MYIRLVKPILLAALRVAMVSPGVAQTCNVQPSDIVTPKVHSFGANDGSVDDYLPSLSWSQEICGTAKRGSKLRASDVVSAFVSANPPLPAAGVQLLVNGKLLAEVHVCYDKQMKFRACDTQNPVAGSRPIQIVPAPQ